MSKKKLRVSADFKEMKIRPDSHLGILMRHFLAGEYCSYETAVGWGVARLPQRMHDLKKKFEDAGKPNPIRTKTVETGGKKKYSLYWIRERGCELDGGEWREY